MKTNRPLPASFQNYTISHATLNTGHLIEAFTEFISANSDHFNAESLDMARYIRNHYESGSFGEDTLSYYLNEILFDMIDTVSPNGFYFGSHPGDGSDFGFWELEDAE